MANREYLECLRELEHGQKGGQTNRIHKQVSTMLESVENEGEVVSDMINSLKSFSILPCN